MLYDLEDAFQILLAHQYVQMSPDCKILVAALAQQVLGPKSYLLIKKNEGIRAKYGEYCWDHKDELNKTARLFYGEVVANKLEAEIKKNRAQLKVMNPKHVFIFSR